MGNQPSVPKITPQDRAILDLKNQRDKLKQYQKKIQAVLDREHEIARMHLAAGRKDRAVIALKRRKYQQSILDKSDGQLENLEQLVSTIEFSLIEVSVLHGLKQGNDVLKEIHKELNVENVERLLDETAEAQAYQREIDTLLSTQLTRDDEEAVMAELAALEAQQVSENVAQEVPVHLPSVPTTEPARQNIEDPTEQRVKLSKETERVAIPA